MTAEQQPVNGVGGLRQEFLSAWISAFARTVEGHVRVWVCVCMCVWNIANNRAIGGRFLPPPLFFSSHQCCVVLEPSPLPGASPVTDAGVMQKEEKEIENYLCIR